MAQEEICIERLVYGGYGLGYLNKQVVFVPFSAPGDKLLIERTSFRKGVQWGEIKQIIEPSLSRTTPFCPNFGTCGGCQLQHISYSSQVQFKQLALLDTITRLTRLRDVKINPCIESPMQKGYRNRVRLQWIDKGGKKGLGFYQPRSHKLVPIDHCPILSDEINKCLGQLSLHLCNNPIRELREIQLTQGSDSQVLLTLIMDSFPKSNSYLNKLRDNIAVSGASICVKAISKTLWGPKHTNFFVGEYKFQASNKAFFQSNISLLPKMIQHILETVKAKKVNVGIELYAGVGVFSIPLSSKVKKLFAVEINRQSVADAVTNLDINKIENVVVYSSAAKDGLDILSDKRPDLVLVDPPREGLFKAVCNKLIQIAPQQLIYISCNPSTLARDLKTLLAPGIYELSEIQPLDMFPHTSHLETVCNLQKRN